MTNPTAKLAPLNLTETVQIAMSLQALVGAQLQECLQTDRGELGLGFYHDRDMLWLWIDLRPQRPMIVRFEGKPPQRKKIPRPLTLFLKSRFLGRRLESVHADLSRGRVLIFKFHRAQSEKSKDPVELEVRLLPHGQNVIAKDGKSQVAEEKPKDLPPAPLETPADLEVRTWEEIEEQWHALSQAAPRSAGANAPSPEKDLEKKWRRAVEKKELALERMREELAEKTSGLEREVGEWLKASGTLEIPRDWDLEKRERYATLINTELSLSRNIETLFTKAKEKERKSEGTRARLKLVEDELVRLKASGPKAFEKTLASKEKQSSENLLARADAKGRQHKVADDLYCYVGKSAADNLALLRKAQSFDYWLHLREQPGSHAILRRTRNRNVTDAEFAEAGRWVVEQSLGKRAREITGERFDLLIVECRYVKPIKGDKIGRVNYTNDRVMTLRF